MYLVNVVVTSSHQGAVFGLEFQTVWRHKLDFVAMKKNVMF